MARFSANGKRLGRPPKQPAAEAAPTNTDALFKQFLARYDAAGRNRRLATWTPPNSGPNTAINGALDTIRSRASDAVRNDWSANAIVTRWATTLVGIAITPRFRRVVDKNRRAAITDLHKDFMQFADADGVLDGYGQQTLAVRSWLEKGEMFARRRWRTVRDGLPVPVQVQLLEADMVPNFDTDSFAGLPQGHYIRSGIEYTRRGQIRAYWVHKSHPGDGASGAPVNPAATMLVRVPAEDMLHVFEPKRIGQRRGVPELSSILVRQRNGVDYEDIVLERQKIANLFVAFITRSLPQLDTSDPNDMAGVLSGLAEQIENGSPLAPMRPGLLQELDDGQNVTFANPPDPATNYSEYLRTTHLGTSAGVGLPYELMSGDIQNVSDRTLRVVINEFRRFASQRQWQIVIPMFCQKVLGWFVDAALLSGAISEEEAEQARRAEHAPHGWEYIHPVQDVQGKALEVTNGFRSRSSVISEAGDDPDVVDQERADDKAREDALGLSVGPDGAPLEDEDGIDDDEYASTQNPAGRGVRAVQAQQEHEARMAAIAARQALADAAAQREAELHASVMALLDEDSSV